MTRPKGAMMNSLPAKLHIYLIGLLLLVLLPAAQAAAEDAGAPVPRDLPAGTENDSPRPGSVADFYLNGKPYYLSTAKETPAPQSTTEDTTAAPAQATKAASPAPRRDISTLYQYRIQRGDTLEKIAAAFNISVRAIKETNGLTDGRIFYGHTLGLPGVPVEIKPAPAQEVNAKAATPEAPAKAPASLDNAKSDITAPAPPANDLSALGLSSRDQAAQKEPAGNANYSDKATSIAGALNMRMGGGVPKFGDTPTMLAGLLLKLALVLVVAYLGVLLLKRLSGARGAARRRADQLQVVETVNLGANRWVHIVSVGDQSFLVGSTPQQTSLLGEIKNTLPAENHPAASPRVDTGFARQLGGLLAQNNSAGTPGGISAASDFLSQKAATLRKLNAYTANKRQA